MIDLINKNAFVTGSSRGIGREIALGLANLGCNIIVHGRTSENCFDTLQLLKKYNVKTYCVYGELSNNYSVNHIIEQVNDLKISIDILYNNAAISSPYKENIWKHSWKDWEKTFNVNVMSLYMLCAAFIPTMIKNDFGRVINLSSTIGDIPELAPYASSKWAVNKLTEDIASKLNDTNVKINMLHPGWLQTDMGGTEADHNVQAVIPGALTPALIDENGPNGTLFYAIDEEQ